MFVSVILIIFCSLAYAEDLTVTLPKYGSITGAEEESRGGVKYISFLGVQYGKAPTDDLRFKDPIRPDKWGSRDAKKFGNKCPQVHPVNPKIVTGDEDCLYLNVYTSKLENDAMRPVVVWIHGGGFHIGGSHTFGARYLMDKPLVLVTFNYRLNAFGFMHYDDKFLPGNVGMKDQVSVLEWVKEHIHLFGGNPAAVTLAGQSAGAACVNWHMYSPLSENLFHQVILQSGTARRIRAGVPKFVAQLRGKAIATMAGCVFRSAEENVKCLRRVPMEELVRIQSRFIIWKGNPYYFGVVIESNASSSQKPFIRANPWYIEPRADKMPVMIGYTRDEGGLTVSGLLRNKGEAIPELGEKYQRLFPILLAHQFNLGLQREENVFKLTDKIRDHYFHGVPISIESFPLIRNMLSDSQVIYDTVSTLNTYKYPRYFYVYSHKNEHTFAEFEKPDFLDKSGPVHSDDLISLFQLGNIFRGIGDLKDADLQVSILMVNLWASFIINGDPNTDNDYETKWKPVNGELQFYNIDIKPEMKELSWENLSFWDGLNWQMEE